MTSRSGQATAFLTLPRAVGVDWRSHLQPDQQPLSRAAPRTLFSPAEGNSRGSSSARKQRYGFKYVALRNGALSGIASGTDVTSSRSRCNVTDGSCTCDAGASASGGAQFPAHRADTCAWPLRLRARNQQRAGEATREVPERYALLKRLIRAAMRPRIRSHRSPVLPQPCRHGA
jgi:hypothetical protein